MKQAHQQIRFFHKKPCVTALMLLLGGTFADQAIAQTYAPWLRQIGVTNAIESAAKWSNGQLALWMPASMQRIRNSQSGKSLRQTVRVPPFLLVAPIALPTTMAMAQQLPVLQPAIGRLNSVR